MPTEELYLNVLRTLCAYRKPKRILEWGPGDSTEVLADSGAEVLSIEHDSTYSQKALIRYQDRPNVQVVQVLHLQPFGKSEGYVTYPIRLKIMHSAAPYDLIFVDGRSRADCIVVGRVVIAQNGLLVVHDAERLNYQRALDAFPHWTWDKKSRCAFAALSSLDWLEPVLGTKCPPKPPAPKSPVSARPTSAPTSCPMPSRVF